MSPSRRRAIGAVRGLAFHPRRRAPPPRSVARVLENAKNLCVPIHPVPSLFVFLCVKNTRPVAVRTTRGPVFVPRRRAQPIAHYTRSLPVWRDGDIAPYRHYTRGILTHRPCCAPCVSHGAVPSRLGTPSPVGAPHPVAARHSPCPATARPDRLLFSVSKTIRL